VEDELLHELVVLDGHRLVEPQLLGGPDEAFALRLLTTTDGAGRVVRADVEDHERDERDHDEEQARPQNSSDQVSEHALSLEISLVAFGVLALGWILTAKDVRRRTVPAPHGVMLVVL
jgi:hypothetical protein